MIRLTRALTICAASIIVASSAAAQDTARPWSGCFKAFEVRKAFDAGKDESQPAVLSVVNIADDSTTTGSYLVDVGVRNKRCSIWQGDSGEFSVGASGEWHLGEANALREEKKRNTLKGAVSAYLSRTIAEGTDADGNETYSVRLWTVLKGEAAKNVIDDTNSLALSLIVTPSVITKGTTSFFPGESLTIGDVTFAYYPSTGPEYIEKLKIGTVAPAFHGVDWLLRVEGLMSIGVSGQGEIDGPVQIVAETGSRWRIAGLDTIAEGSLYFVNLTATVWLDDARRIGVGVSFDTGRTPTTNFIAQRRNSIGLQLKF